MQINLNRHRSILRLAVSALAILLGIGTFGAVAQKRPPDKRIIVDPYNTKARAAQPDLIIKQFLFPPTNGKALRVHVVNKGQAVSGACRLFLTERKINGVTAGRQTHVNVPALAAGADVWVVIDAKRILPDNVSLQYTTFKLNVDATEIVAESNESNNEVWHNLSDESVPATPRRRTPRPASEPERTPPPRRVPAADPGATQKLSTGRQPTLDREALEQSLHAALAPNVMGYTFLLMKDGRLVSEGAGGLARNAADGEMKMTTRTPQNMGSLFKFITGVTVLHLLDRAPAGSAGGNNSFETRLGAQVTLLYPQLWNSAIKWPTIRGITFRHLLQHRSGFRACNTPLGCFGKRYNNSLFGVRDYENINFQLLGFLIPLYTNPELIPALNAVTKTVSEAEGDNHIQMVLSDRMDRFITQKMFPLAPGRISASCDAANEYKATGAYGYISKSDTEKGIITSRKAGGKPCVGSGGYWMSIRDFGAFAAAALHSDRMLSEQARLEMYRTGMAADDRLVWSSTQSDSWIADNFNMSTIILSNGAQPYEGGQGFSTVLLRLPLNYELMVFVNSKGMDANELSIAGRKAFRAGMEANFQ